MDAIRITGLWRNKDKKGNTFLSGSLNSIINLMVMPNTFKKEGDDKAPDYFVYFSQREKETKARDVHTNIADL